MKKPDNWEEYIKSDRWKALVEEHPRAVGYRCQVCNREGELQGHHRTYENFGNEEWYDVVILCKKCHSLAHRRPFWAYRQ